MKATITRERLASGFQTAASVAPSRSPKPIIQNVKLEVGPSGATLLATDLEISVRIEIPDAVTEVAGSVLLPVGKFGSILRESRDESIRIESDGNATEVRGEHSQFKLAAENPAEFPTVPGFDEKSYFELPAPALRELIRRTAFATDAESSRYALGGVLLELGDPTLTAVGTDGRRLARAQAACKRHGEVGGDSSTIVPTRAMQLIERALADEPDGVKLASRGNDVLVRSSRVTIISRLVEGRFPRWRDVFPQRSGSSKVQLVVEPFHAAVRQAAIVSHDESRGVDFTFAEGRLVLDGRSAQFGQSHVDLPIPYDGPRIQIRLDPRYVTDYLRVLSPDVSTTLDIKDGESAALFTTDDGYAYVIMPLARDR